MTTFTRDSDGIPRCQVLVNGQPCNGFLLLTQDNHYLVCEHCHGKLIPIDSAQATLIRQAYKRRDDPSKAELNRRWKETLPVAVKVGTITKTDPVQSHIKKQVHVYKLYERLCQLVRTADRNTTASVQQYVGCTVSKSGSRSVKLFELASQETVALMQVKADRKKSKGKEP